MKLVFRSFSCRAVRDAWKSMETPDMSPYLYYEYMRYVERSTRLFRLYFPCVACVEDKGEICMLIPMMKSFFGYYKMLGDIQGCGRCDALWRPEATPEERTEYTEFFFRTIRNKCKLNRIHEDSPLARESVSGRIQSTHAIPYVEIDVPNDVQSYLKKLSPSVQQNIRTAYNRTRRDGIGFELVVFDKDHPITDSMWKEIMDVYIERLFSKYKKKKVRHMFRKAYETIKYRYFKHDTLSLRRLANSFHAVLMDGEEIMAFMSGFYTYDRKSVTIPRLAINDKYHFYSPGMLLSLETLRYLSGTDVGKLDLSRGDEKYKRDLGGVVYYTRDMVLNN